MSLFDGFFDDAAVFPPGNAPLSRALCEHHEHGRLPRSRYVGPLVLPVAAVPELNNDRPAMPDSRPLTVALTFGDGPSAVEAALSRPIPGLRIVAVEVALPPNISAARTLSMLEKTVPPDVGVFVELPRDSRRYDLIDALRATGYCAKIRTGGVTAGEYPDELGLGATIIDLVAVGVSFKATAGLHRAIRNTDPRNGFEQHGFLNIMLAVSAAVDGADTADVVEILGARDANALARQLIGAVDEQVVLTRRVFRSLGTCSVIEPLEDLVALGLLPADALDDVVAVSGSIND
ncbi:hypothetical protein [Mycobacterium sp. E1747]|uniref:hypothetical protein n=1 Tax=Mycobacterium sp. E1747 TaxID=1834128 RepID=UPI000801CF9E|nr:hypothetical protein [Mycobacterium sp. E1747]OBH13567.1 hypothetical protein A5695_13575 [Mycobacterium sp. E1747]